MRVDTSDEDALITEFITAARRVVEARTGRALVTQTLRLTLDCFPAAREISLRRGPVESVVTVKSIDQSGVATVFPASNYALDGVAHPARLVRAEGAVWPIARAAAGGVEIDFVAGYGTAASDVPSPLRQAIRILTANFHDQREAVSENLGGLPYGVEAMLAPFAEVRL